MKAQQSTTFFDEALFSSWFSAILENKQKLLLLLFSRLDSASPKDTIQKKLIRDAIVNFVLRILDP
jgi:hypothetical protein